jgi:hypothetical protein
MANALNMDLADCVVVLGREHFPANEPKWNEEHTRTVLVRGGVGSKGAVRGSWMWVTDENGEAFRAHGWMVRRLVRQPVPQNHATYAVSVMDADGVQTLEIVATSPLAASYRVMHDLGWMQLSHTACEKHGDLFVEAEGARFVLTASPRPVAPLGPESSR